MLVLLTVAAANAMTLPSVQSGLLKPSFKAAMNQGGSAAVRVRVVVSPTGMVSDCSKAFLNGPAENVDAFCSMLRTRQFAPAHDPGGQAAFGVIYVWSQWKDGHWTGSDMPEWSPPHLALETNRMPKGFAPGSLFRLIVQTDVKGTIQSCTSPATNLPTQAQDLLCREAAAVQIGPVTDQGGNAVPGIQEFFVRLTPKSTIDAIMKRLQQH